MGTVRQVSGKKQYLIHTYVETCEMTKLALQISREKMGNSVNGARMLCYLDGKN